jgi:hypothetical protein
MNAVQEAVEQTQYLTFSLAGEEYAIVETHEMGRRETG